ncbi:MAG TPA: recombinase family protein [Terriglobales bacterium]
MKRAFAYRRVSSVGQSSDDRDGLVRQQVAIREYCRKNEIRIVRWFTDSISGKTDLEDRPALYDLMQALHANGTKTVIIEKLDRLARSLLVQESIVADFKRHGFEIVSCAEPDLLSDDPTRVLLRQMMGAFAEYERAMIVQKLRGARQRARANRDDYREGRKPYGFRPGEQHVIARIRQMREQGFAYDTIAGQLNSEDVPARAGRWHATSVSRVLRRVGTQLF